MVRYTKSIDYLERRIILNAENGGIKLTTAIIGILTYNIVVIPILSLIVVDTLKVNGDYLIPIAIAWVFIGIYVTENFACRNIQ